MDTIITQSSCYELVDLFYQRFDSFQTLWVIYTTVIIGIVSILISFPKHLNSKLVRVIMILSFWLFAYVNLNALTSVQQDRHALYEIVNEMSESQSGVNLDLCKTITAKDLKSESSLILFHVTQSLIITILIILLPRRLVSTSIIKSFNHEELHTRRLELPNPIISWSQVNKLWVLEEDVLLDLKLKDHGKCELLIPKGFVFDLASVPKFLWWIIAPFELSIIAPLVHDYIYVNKGDLSLDDDGRLSKDIGTTAVHISRHETDSIFLAHMKIENVGKVKRKLCYIGVRAFGGLFWKDNSAT